VNYKKNVERTGFRYLRAQSHIDGRKNQGFLLSRQTTHDYQEENGNWKTRYQRLSYMPALKLFHGSFIQRKSFRAKLTLRELVIETKKDGSIIDSVRFGLRRARKFDGSNKRWVNIDFDWVNEKYDISINGQSARVRRKAKRALEQAEKMWVDLNESLMNKGKN
jgi:hypothetical protein